MYSALLLLFITCPAALANYTFNPVTEETPIIITKLAKAHVSYDNFKMVFYVNLTSYQDLTIFLHSCVATVDKAIQNHPNQAFNLSLSQLRNRLNNLFREEDFMGAYRQKRFVLCEFCGTVDNYLFGVMTQSQAEEWAGVVNAIANQSISNHDLIRQQTILAEAQLKYNSDTFRNIESALSASRNEIDRLRNDTSLELNSLHTKIEIQSLIQIAQLAFDEHAHLYGQIRRALNNVRKGSISELIPKENLKEELLRITKHIKATQKLPIEINSENVMHIFKFSRISSTLFDNKLLIEINIPITETEEFSLYKATPIPISSKRSSVIATPFSTYFLLNVESTKYIALDKKQIDNGLMLANNEMLYKPMSTSRLDKMNICEWLLQSGPNIDDIIKACRFQPYFTSNTFISILENNLYFMETHGKILIGERCNGSDYVSKPLQGRGTLQLDPNCAVKIQSIIIEPQRSLRINATAIIQPEITATNINESDLLSWINTDHSLGSPRRSP